MLPRERIQRILDYQSPDCVGLEYHCCARGLYEHGDKLRKMIKAMPGDFEDFSDTPIPVMPQECLDADGRYHQFIRDEWGTLWEYRIFAMAGHPVGFPLEDMDRLKDYQFPKHAYENPEVMETLRQRCQKTRPTHFFKTGWFGILEKLHALRPFEDVLMDILDDTQPINDLADRLVAYQLEEIEQLLNIGVDGVRFGDDYGTQNSMLLSPSVWRRFFKPRLKKMIHPIKAAGKRVFFHSCGYIAPILPDLKEIGVDAVWPQMTVYPGDELPCLLRELKLATALHIDRANLMTRGTPEEVSQTIERIAKTFAVDKGGSWFYVETDNGFPFENIQALLCAIARWR